MKTSVKYTPHVIAALALAVFTGITAAEDVTVTATITPSVVPVGNEAVLTVTVEGSFRKTGAPELPALDDFYVYESGTSQSFNFINGAVSSSVSYNYTLVPRNEGTFVIEPIRVIIKDKEYTANPLTVEVVAAASSVSPPPPGQQPAPTPRASEAGPETDSSIFINARVDRDTVYVNQQITWTLGYYSDGRVNLLGSPNYTPPQAEGFWVEDLPPQNKYYTTINRRQYLVNEIKRGYFPTSPGLFEIGEARVSIMVDESSSRDFDNFFRRPFRSFGTGRPQVLQTEKKKVVVLPLPQAGKPADFDGIVAQDLQVSMAADKQVVQVGEPVNVTIELNGKGNIKTIKPPSIAASDAYKVYESGSSSDVFKKDYVVAGRITSEYVVIPRNQGKLTLPAIRVPYFDPTTRRYSVAQSYPIQLDVRPGTNEDGRKVIYAGGGDDFEVISRDIRYIHPVPSAVLTAREYLFQNRFYAALHAVPVIAVVFSLVVESRRKKFRRNAGFARAVRALKDADKKLGAANKSFREGRMEEGFTGVSAALVGYFADKMNVAPSGLTAEVIERFLDERGVDDETRSELNAIITTCDQARFAAASLPPAAAERAVEKARSTLRTMEKGYMG